MPVGVFIAALALYLATLAPTLTVAHFGADGGDFAAAIATHGVPHPPGYPTYLAIGSLFAQLPLGTIAFRLNLLSAMCMALTAAITTWGVSKVASPSTSTLAGLAFAAAPMVWGQATIAEVHALNALFVAIILGLLAPIVFRSDTASTSHLALACFIWGLGLGNQLTLLALLPFFISAARSATRAPYVSRFTRYSILITAFLTGLSIYMLIPLRAAAQPPINWLGEVTPQNVINFITADLYRGYAFTVPLSDLPTRLLAFTQIAVAQFGWAGVLLGAFGAWQMILKKQRGLSAVIPSALLYLIFTLGYNTPDSDLYLIPVWLFGTWSIAAGAHNLLGRAPAVLRRPSFVAVLILIPGLGVITNYAALDLHADRTSETFAQQVWGQSPRDSIVITHTDAQTFTLWYYRLVEQQRPDVTVIDARLVAYEWSAPMLRAQDAKLNLVAYDPEAAWLDRLRAANPARPVCEIAVITSQVKCP